MSFDRFEEIPVWQEARTLTRRINSITREYPFSKDYSMRDQIRRASVSIMSNIAEGFERDSNKEFIRFLSYAKGSAGEVRNLIYIAADEGYLDEQLSEELRNSCMSISRQIAGFQKYLKGN